MSDPEIFYVSEFSEIPTVFLSDLTQSPLENCVLCERFLLEDGTPYIIEKSFKRNLNVQVEQTLFEYAMCMECAQKMRGAISVESAQAIERFMSKHVDMLERRKKLVESGDFSMDAWLGTCLITGKRMDELSEYQISCQCDGQHLLFTYMPYMISEKAIEMVVDQISKKTKDELDDFRDKFLGPSPEIRDLLPDRPLVLI